MRFVAINDNVDTVNGGNEQYPANHDRCGWEIFNLPIEQCD